MNPSAVDVVDDDNSYVGYIKQGTTGSDAVKAADDIWVIKKIVTSGTVTTVKFADGSTEFNKAWDDRADYTYMYP
jgi:hypothetical protein